MLPAWVSGTTTMQRCDVHPAAGLLQAIGLNSILPPQQPILRPESGHLILSEDVVFAYSCHGTDYVATCSHVWGEAQFGLKRVRSIVVCGLCRDLDNRAYRAFLCWPLLGSSPQETCIGRRRFLLTMAGYEWSSMAMLWLTEINRQILTSRLVTLKMDETCNKAVWCRSIHT